MDDDASSKDAGGAVANQQAGQTCRQAGDSGRISHQLRHIAAVMVGVLWIAMRFARRIEMSASTRRVRRAAIAFFVNMESMRARRQARDFCRNQHGVAVLPKNHGSGHAVTLRRFQYRFGLGAAGAAARTGTQCCHDRQPNPNRLLFHRNILLEHGKSRRAPTLPGRAPLNEDPKNGVWFRWQPRKTLDNRRMQRPNESMYAFGHTDHHTGQTR